MNRTINFLFFYFVAFVKKKLLKMTHRHIHIQVYMLNFVVGQQGLSLLNGLLYMPKNMVLLVQNFFLGGGEKKKVIIQKFRGPLSLRERGGG